MMVYGQDLGVLVEDEHEDRLETQQTGSKPAA